jgi:hypothetical protein
MSWHAFLGQAAAEPGFARREPQPEERVTC